MAEWRVGGKLRDGLKESVDFRTRVCGDTVRNFVQGVLRQTLGAELRETGRLLDVRPPG